ncbi:hypothetical protein IAT38_005209 [Cryptococcus sp. DSM 104549]
MVARAFLSFASPRLFSDVEHPRRKSIDRQQLGMPAIDEELELITASLLPAESASSSASDVWPRTIDIISTDSPLSLHVRITSGYARRDAVEVEVKSADMGRDEATRWKEWVHDKMENWEEDNDYPLYQILTEHFLPLLSPSNPLPPHSSEQDRPTNDHVPPSPPHHVLLISHHLLSPTKRKDLIALSSTLSLTGFSKPGHPGIMYAIGELGDLEEWVREVKSWNWLALRVRMGPEPVEGEDDRERKGNESGARGGKGRGEWVELEKIGDALEWLRGRGEDERAKILTDVGVGGGKS